MYRPGAAGVLLNPFYFSRKGLMSAMERHSKTLQGPLLDIGCGTKPYRDLFPTTIYVGLEIDHESSRKRGIADAFYDGTVFPFADGEFSAVLCNQVLEHVFNPQEFLSEVHRVLKPGGRMLLSVPFVWDEHEQPFDYARYSSFGLAALMRESGFRVVCHEKLGADVTVIWQLINAYWYKVFLRAPSVVRALAVLFLMAPMNVLGLISRRLLPSNPDLFLDHVILVEKPT
jgi:SAM-dependent methyltransferase